MVMFFNVKEVREFLLRNKHVYTIRKKRCRVGNDIAVYGNYYNHTTIAKVWIEEVPVGEVDDWRKLRSYVKKSGLWDSSVPPDNSALEWYRKARKLHKVILRNPIKLHLYHVSIRKEDG